MKSSIRQPSPGMGWHSKNHFLALLVAFYTNLKKECHYTQAPNPDRPQSFPML
ncbi:hypothetical protein NDA07_02725 [Microcoleus vaginatus DQ-U2]|uniref:hypothetical protein n=1 Tax=Microcoleus vaginatus TaxID=119532 RepID=UPI0019A80925|nr:hypothetical protein [Microcoleus sp. FACHB-DQ6]